jgi:Family of unknown function (DUF6152)
MRQGVRRISAKLLMPAIVLLAGARPLLAHHAFAAEYDANRKVLLTGSVTKIDWTNPHAHFFLDVRDGSGKVSTWDLELASPNTLERGGWTRKSLKVGDVVTVNGYLAKDGSNLAHARDIRLADGRRVPVGSAPETQ